VSVRLDPQVLEGLRSKGEGPLTRINNILMNLMEAERRAASGKLASQVPKPGTWGTRRHKDLGHPKSALN